MGCVRYGAGGIRARVRRETRQAMDVETGEVFTVPVSSRGSAVHVPSVCAVAQLWQPWQPNCNSVIDSLDLKNPNVTTLKTNAVLICQVNQTKHTTQTDNSVKQTRNTYASRKECYSSTRGSVRKLIFCLLGRFPHRTEPYLVMSVIK